MNRGSFPPPNKVLRILHAESRGRVLLTLSELSARRHLRFPWDLEVQQQLSARDQPDTKAIGDIVPTTRVSAEKSPFYDGAAQRLCAALRHLSRNKLLIFYESG